MKVNIISSQKDDLEEITAKQGVGPVDFDKMPTIEDEDDGFEEDIEQHRHGDKKEIERLKRKNNDLMDRLVEARDIVLDLFAEACAIDGPEPKRWPNLRYDHQCNSAYEYAQKKLIEWGDIKQEDCERK